VIVFDFTTALPRSWMRPPQGGCHAAGAISG
jgi:hypothetical protein